MDHEQTNPGASASQKTELSPGDLKTLLTEWKAIREALLYFGNRRFAQFTVFMVASGFSFKNFLELDNKLFFQSIIVCLGLALTILFWQMEVLSVCRRDRFAGRAKDIEDQMDTIKLMRDRVREETINKEAKATYIVYGLVLTAWVILAVYSLWQKFCPQ